MIQTVTQQTCTGCCACMNACPTRCITMKEDHEGFWYPKVDATICNHCGLCRRVCPLIEGNQTLLDRLKSPDVLAVRNTDHAIRLDSTSGGVFSALASRMLDLGGHIAGAIYADDHSVLHVVTSQPKMLAELRSSKYLQSFTGNTFAAVKKLLDEGTRVLICGTPCQIAGLYGVLGKDYEGLVTCDFICAGVNSPRVFLMYIRMLEQQYGARATKIKFKDKTHGWHTFSTRVEFGNGKTYIKDRYHDLFMVGYLRYNCFMRPCCYSCQFKGISRRADITLGDFWGIERTHPELDDDCGTSVVLLNSEKGRRFFQGVAGSLSSHQCTLGEVAGDNPRLRQSPERKPARDGFFNDIDKLPFLELSERHFPVPGRLEEIGMKLLSKAKGLGRWIVRGAWRHLGFSYRAWSQFVYINMLRTRTQSSVGRAFIPAPHCCIVVEPSARIVLHGRLLLGAKENRKSTAETQLSLGRHSVLRVNGDISIGCGSDIRVFDGAEVILNGGYCNANVQIVCARRIAIGKGCAIAQGVIIRDTDGHQVLTSSRGMTEEVFIGEHVWIGSRASIMKGVTVSDGAIIAAGAVVTKDVPARCLVAGIPARVVQENVDWK